MDWSVGLLGGAVIILLGMIIIALRILGGSPFQGLLWFELTRIARRGTPYRWRWLFCFLLTVCLLITYQANVSKFSFLQIFQLSTIANSNVYLAKDFSEQLAHLFIITQMSLILLATPAIYASGIVEEYQKQTWDFLRTTLMTDLQIIVSKWLANTIYLIFILLAVLPILMLATFFGGIKPERFLAIFLVGIFTIFSLGAMAIYQSVCKETMVTAISRTYFVLLGMTLCGGCCCGFPILSAVSPITVSVFLYESRIGSIQDRSLYIAYTVLTYAIIHSAITVYMIVCAVGALRSSSQTLRAKSSTESTDTPLSEIQLAEHNGTAPPNDPRIVDAIKVAHATQQLLHHHPMGDNQDPIAWKEELQLIFRRDQQYEFVNGFVFCILGSIGFGLAVMLGSALLDLYNQQPWPMKDLNRLCRFAVIGSMIIVPFILGIQVLPTLIRERQQQTWQCLLSLPLSLSELILPRMSIMARHFRTPLIVILTLPMLVGVPLAGFPLLPSVLAMCQIIASCVLALAAAMYLSARCRGLLTAWFVWLLLMSSAAFAGEAFVDWLNQSLYLDLPWDQHTPIGQLWYGLEYSESQTPIQRWLFRHPHILRSQMVTILLTLSLTWIFWKLTLRHLQKDYAESKP